MEKHIDIQKDVVTFQQAIDLCVLGFNEKTLCAYEIENQELYLCHLDEEGLYMPEKDIAAPLKQQVFRWFRDNYDLFVVIDYDVRSHIRNKEGKLLYEHCKDRKYAGFVYEEAESACIDKLIELVKQK